ncbi:MAG: hypothetical protein H7Y17_05215 [Chlorobia bacterium]|nr:hypothetical protein [Fimbriimonadaceae bacterium]
MSTSIFADETSATRSLNHLATVLGEPLPDTFPNLFQGNADADLALTNLGRWLAATANPHLHLSQLVSVPQLARLLINLFGASQPITDSLIQNPELASLVLEPYELERLPTRDAVVREGGSMLATSTSHSHALDRLRFLKQRWTLPIVINDLAGNWPEESVWQAISDLAEGLITLTAQAVWTEFAKQKGLQGDCPVLIVGFGKLGGRELNFSSDIDLAYAVPDGMGEVFESEATRFCELLGRAFSDRMGRGSLYRVDLRLRPYGNSGPLVASMRSFEAYYKLYAEQWEVQALIRSKPIVGPPELQQRWLSMRTERCFRPQLSEPELEAMLAMKTRIEERSDSDDLKRGAGGIRDVEFLVQALQLIHGYKLPSLQVAPTLEVLRELEDQGILDHPVASSLEKGYVFLRQLEHRCQLVGDRQTHSIPADPAARTRLAKLLGRSTWPEVDGELEAHRRTIQTLYKSILRPEPSAGSDRDQIAERLEGLAPSALQWFDSLPSPDAFYASLIENRDSLDRVEKIARSAPRLVNDLKESIGLTEMLVSGEIEEEVDSAAMIHRLALGCPIKQLAEAFVRARCHLMARWVLSQDFDPGEAIADLTDALIIHCAKRLLVRFDIVGLGSYGGREMGIDSDADLFLLVEKTEWQSEAESQAQQFLSLLSQLKRVGVPIGVDLRLRPDGGKGMLVRSLEALGTYELSGMEMWERFALGQAREIFGGDRAIETVRKVAFAQPLTPERLRELLAMKKRVETERIKPQHLRREVKIGFGGLNDVEWLVHLFEMRYPTATHAPEALVSMSVRIQNLGNAGLLNAVEVQQLQHAHRHLIEVRLRLGLLSLEKDVIPENPDKLDRLADSMDLSSGNDFLALHERVIETVRAIYIQGLERLKA